MRRAALLVAALALPACAGPLDAPRSPAPLDEAYFRCHVEPVVTKWCGQLACHGDGSRHFRVFARGRLRMFGTELDRAAALHPEERAQNFVDAAALVVPGDPDASLLLQKPLAIAGGGRFHRATALDANIDVFPSRDDRDYIVLTNWVHGAVDDPTCIEPGSDQ